MNSGFPILDVCVKKEPRDSSISCKVGVVLFILLTYKEYYIAQTDNPEAVEEASLEPLWCLFEEAEFSCGPSKAVWLVSRPLAYSYGSENVAPTLQVSIILTVHRHVWAVTLASNRHFLPQTRYWFLLYKYSTHSVFKVAAVLYWGTDKETNTPNVTLRTLYYIYGFVVSSSQYRTTVFVPLLAVLGRSSVSSLNGCAPWTYIYQGSALYQIECFR